MGGFSGTTASMAFGIAIILAKSRLEAISFDEIEARFEADVMPYLKGKRQ
jgi:hypothetical protein